MRRYDYGRALELAKAITGQSPKDYYGDPIFTTGPDNVLSFTRICPGGKAGA